MTSCSHTGIAIPNCACPACFAAMCMCSRCRPQLEQNQPKEDT